MANEVEVLNVKIEEGLVVVEPVSVPVIFSKEENMIQIVDMIKAEVAKHEPDLTTKKGRDAIKSLAYTVTRSKTTLDNLGKDLVSDLKAKVGAVDAVRKIARDSLDTLKNEIKAPLEDWERKEEERVLKITETMNKLQAVQSQHLDDSESYINLRAYVEGIEITDDMDEFKEPATELKAQVLADLDRKISDMQKHEAEKAELEQLRREKLEREAEDLRLKQVEEAKERKLQIEKETKEREERIRKSEQERLEKEQHEALKKAEREKEEALEKAELEKKAAIQEERERIEREQKEKEAAAEKIRLAEEKKAANKRHQGKINREIVKALMNIGQGDEILSKQEAEEIVKAIATGKIPNVTINY